jgi:hypothetical protein
MISSPGKSSGIVKVSRFSFADLQRAQRGDGAVARLRRLGGVFLETGQVQAFEERDAGGQPLGRQLRGQRHVAGDLRDPVRVHLLARGLGFFLRAALVFAALLVGPDLSVDRRLQCDDLRCDALGLAVDLLAEGDGRGLQFLALLLQVRAQRHQRQAGGARGLVARGGGQVVGRALVLLAQVGERSFGEDGFGEFGRLHDLARRRGGGDGRAGQPLAVRAIELGDDFGVVAARVGHLLGDQLLLGGVAPHRPRRHAHALGDVIHEMQRQRLVADQVFRRVDEAVVHLPLVRFPQPM